MIIVVIFVVSFAVVGSKVRMKNLVRRLLFDIFRAQRVRRWRYDTRTTRRGILDYRHQKSQSHGSSSVERQTLQNRQ